MKRWNPEKARFNFVVGKHVIKGLTFRELMTLFNSANATAALAEIASMRKFPPARATKS